MQKILSRKALSLLMKPQTLIPLLSTPVFSLTYRATFNFAQDTEKSNKFESQSPSFEGIINSISNAENTNQVLEAFDKAGKHYRNEQVVLSLRMLGRLIRTRGDNLSKDERFVKLQEKMMENLDNCTDHELLDLLFWLRKFRMFKVQVNIPDKEIQRIYYRINDFIKSKSYSCRNLINIYFDYCHMNQLTDSVAQEILNEIRQDSKILTTFSCIQIIQGVSYKTYFNMRDSQLLNQIIRVIPTFEQDFDIEQKSTIFKHLSKMELNFSPPRFSVPNVIYKLKDQLKDKIEQLGEMAVNNIIEAYESLPKEFPVDLLEEIKEMMCVTIQHNPKVISSNFLLGIYESFANLKTKKRRIAEQKLVILEKELLQRIKDGDPDLNRMKSLEIMLEIYQKTGKNEEGLKTIYEAFGKAKAKDNNSRFPGFYGIEIFAKNNMDVRNFIDEELVRDTEKSKVSTTVYLYNLLHFLKLEKYNPQLESLKPKVEALMISDTVNVFRSLINSEIKGPMRNELFLQAMPQLQRLFQEKTVNSRFFFKLVLESCVSKNLREEWLKYFTSISERFAKEDLLKIHLVEALGSIEYPENEAVSLLFNLYNFSKPSANDIKKLLFVLKDNQRLLVLIEKSDFLMQRLTKHLLEVIKEESEKVRVSNVYQIILKINAIRPRNNHLYPALDLLLASNLAFDTFTQLQAAIFLLNKRSLSPKTAEIVYKKLDNLKNLQDMSGKIKLFNQSVQGQQLNEKTLEILQKNYTVIKDNLNNPNARQVLINLTTILSFPPELIKEDADFLKKTLGDFIQQGNTPNYMGLLRSISVKYFNDNRMMYTPLIKELTSNFNNFSQRMPYGDILDCLEIFSRLGVKNPAIFNLIIENIGKNFGQTRIEDFISILRDFSYIGLKQVDLFDKILQRILERPPSTLRAHFNDIFNSLYTISYDSELIKKEFPNILTTLGILNSTNFRNFIVALNYIPLLEVKDEGLLMESLAGKLTSSIKTSEVKTLSNAFVNHSFFLTLLYLKLVMKNKPELGAALEAAIIEKDKEAHERMKNTGKRWLEHQNKKKAIEIVESFLKVMKIPYQLDFVVSDVPIDVYLPSQKILIKVLAFRDLNYDKKTLKGSANVLTKIYKSFTDYQTICVSIHELNSNADNLSKIKYLQELGLKSPVTENEFDYSLIKTVERPNKKFKESHTEDVIEEEVVAEEGEETHTDKIEKVKDTPADEVEEKVAKKE